jgi:hypothetical protein
VELERQIKVVLVVEQAPLTVSDMFLALVVVAVQTLPVEEEQLVLVLLEALEEMV